jgi:hypothetical protein
MGHWLARGGAAARRGFVKRFDPRLWTVNFPRPMMASVVTIAADALRVDAVFYRGSDLAGLIWESEDRHDHPLLAYETARDFRRCTLAFRWRSAGLMPLDAVNGPTLTIEGRDEAGAEEGWRRAALEVSFDSGGSWTSPGGTAAPATIGSALDALAPAGSALADTESVLDVELLNAAMWLESRSDDALAGGANLALVGEELIQFGAAEPIGANRFRLSRLWRGRRGTEWAAGLHAAGEDFVLIEAESLVALAAPAGSAGGEARLIAYGIGDAPGGVLVTRPIASEALRPPSPVHFTAEPQDGGLMFRWVRRSRQGWPWPGGSDTPLGEESERYRLELSGEGFTRIATPAEPFYHYSAAERAADGGGAVAASVSQIGTFAASRPATLSVS